MARASKTSAPTAWEKVEVDETSAQGLGPAELGPSQAKATETAPSFGLCQSQAMNLESGQKWPFFPVNLSPTPPASSPLHPSLLNQLNGVSCYLPLPLSPLPPSTTLWPTCPSCSLPLVFIFQLSALDPSTPAPVLTRLTLPDGGPRILQLFACTKDCAFMALIEAPFPQSDIVPDPQDEEEWRDERVLRLLSGPFPPPPQERKGRVLTLGEMAIEVFVRRRGWKREIARVPSHFQELVGAHRERCALIDLLEVSRAEGREVVKRHGGRRIKLGELETVYPERWVKGKHYEVDWPNGPDVKKDYWDDDDLEDPTFGPTNAFKLLGFPTFGTQLSSYFGSLRCATNYSFWPPCRRAQAREEPVRRCSPSGPAVHGAFELPFILERPRSRARAARR